MSRECSCILNTFQHLLIFLLLQSESRLWAQSLPWMARNYLDESLVMLFCFHFIYFYGYLFFLSFFVR